MSAFPAADVNIDLFHDWAEYLRELLKADGHTLPPAMSDEDVCLAYYDYTQQFPSSRPRRILKPQGFSCPSEVASGLAYLEGKFESGGNLRPHLSRSAGKLGNKDFMLIDWGIFHFHLGTTPHQKNPALVASTGPVLYARLTADTAYVIGIMNHGEWANADLVRILHDNWPESIECYKMKGVIGLTRSISSDDRQYLRKGFINTPIELAPGVVYACLGSGFTSCGATLAASMKLNRCKEWLEESQNLVRSNASQWIGRAKAPDGPFNFKLIVNAGEFYAVDKTQGIGIPLGNPAL